jgi:hypothetical protein
VVVGGSFWKWSALGYFPKAEKCWLIAKPEREDTARELFANRLFVTELTIRS